MTRLETFLKSRGIKPAVLARESGYSRQYLLLVRKGRVEPTRRAIAAITATVSRLIRQAVTPTDLFEFAPAAELPRTTRVAKANALAAPAQRLLDSVAARPPDSWQRAFADAQIPPGVAAAIIVQHAYTLIGSDPRRAAAVFGTALAILGQRANNEQVEHASLRARALIGRAHAYSTLCRYGDAFADAAAAEAALLRHTQLANELGQAWYARGRVAMLSNLYTEAADWACRARFLFSLLGDRRRAANALILEGAIAHDAGDAAGARAIFTEALEPLEESKDHAALASAWLNLGRCELELGMRASAERWLQQARKAFARRHMPMEAMRATWHLTFAEGLYGDTAPAVAKLTGIRRRFLEHRALSDAAFVALDMVDLLVQSNDLRQAAEVCRAAVRDFERIGEAINLRKALAHLGEILRQGGDPIQSVKELRSFLTRWKNNPAEVLSAPLP